MEQKVNVEIEKRNKQSEMKRYKGYILGIRKQEQKPDNKEENK